MLGTQVPDRLRARVGWVRRLALIAGLACAAVAASVVTALPSSALIGFAEGGLIQ